MSHVHIADLTKPGTVVISDGGVTATITHQPHNLKVCVCDNCNAIKKKQADAAAAEKKKKNEEKFIAHLYGCKLHPKH